jgi:hypothetical protein
LSGSGRERHGIGTRLPVGRSQGTPDQGRQWAEIFGDPVAVAAMVDRLVHHAEVIVLKGDSYRLRSKRQEVLTGEKER